MINQIEQAAEVIKTGGVLLYPTDTIWGLGCDPTNKTAIAKLDAFKERTSDKNYIILIHEERLLNQYVAVIPEVAYELLDFATKPLTIIYPKATKLIAHLAAPDGSIAIRLTKDRFCVGLMQKLKSGIISTSANVSGQAYTKEGVEILKSKVDFTVDPQVEWNESQTPSQIIQLKENGEFKIVRG